MQTVCAIPKFYICHAIKGGDKIEHRDQAPDVQIRLEHDDQVRFGGARLRQVRLTLQKNKNTNITQPYQTQPKRHVVT